MRLDLFVDENTDPYRLPDDGTVNVIKPFLVSKRRLFIAGA